VAAVALGLAVVDRSSWESHLSGGSCKVRLQHTPRLNAPLVLCLSEAFAAKHRSLCAFLRELAALKDSKWQLQVGPPTPAAAKPKKDEPPTHEIKDLPTLADFIRKFRRLSKSTGLHVGSVFCRKKKERSSGSSSGSARQQT
jgi:hypothetical protein